MGRIKPIPLDTHEAFTGEFHKHLKAVRKWRFWKSPAQDKNPLVAIVGGELAFALSEDTYTEIMKTIKAGVDMLIVGGPILMKDENHPLNPLLEYVSRVLKGEEKPTRGRLQLFLTDKYEDCPPYHFLLSPLGIQIERPHRPSQPGYRGVAIKNSIVWKHKLLNELNALLDRTKEYSGGEIKHMDREELGLEEDRNENFKKAWKSRVTLALPGQVELSTN